MSDDLRARLDRLKPATAIVLVDDVELRLRKPKLLAYGDFMEAVSAIDPEPLFAAGLPVVMSALEAGSEGDLLRALAESGPAIWRAITGNLGRPAAGAIAAGVAALLDTEANFDTLVQAGKFGKPPEIDRDEHDRGYVCSATLRAWVARNVELDQALYVVEQAWSLARVAELGKALSAGMKARPATPSATPPVEPRSVAG